MTPIQELIKRRRAQMLVHSCIYYELNSNIISDHLWQQWADELEVLQRENPGACSIGFFDDEFKDWTGATGNHLPHRDPWVLRESNYILRISQNPELLAHAAEVAKSAPLSNPQEFPAPPGTPTPNESKPKSTPKKKQRVAAKPTEVTQKPSLFD